MYAALTIIRYPILCVPFAFAAMLFHRFPLWISKKISFYKLLGSGRNGTFDKVPDLQQWAIFTVHDEQPENTKEPVNSELYGKFISAWFRLFKCETFTILLQTRQGHGKWDGRDLFSQQHIADNGNVMIATLTRATIRLGKLKYFWQNVAPVAAKIRSAKGFVCSFGIGEIPWVKQATFSVWESETEMKNFAYGLKVHADVIKKTRLQNWYSEEMFVRFNVLRTYGTVKGVNPVRGHCDGI